MMTTTATRAAGTADPAKGTPSTVAPARLRAEAVTLGYRDRTIVEGLDLAVPDGEVTAIVGPNGCGKSTLLRGLARLLPVKAGRVLLDGKDLAKTPTKAVAQRIGLLPQAPIAPEGLTVAELVAHGRHPHQGILRRASHEDDLVVAQALELTGTTGLAERLVDELSGGQRQRVWIALALAQQPDILLLDEPTSFLDIAHQIEVLDLVRTLNRDSGTTVVMVLHDLAMAARYATHLVAMRDGRILAEGDPRAVVTEDLVHEVFDVRCRILTDPETGTPVVLPRATQEPS